MKIAYVAGLVLLMAGCRSDDSHQFPIQKGRPGERVQINVGFNPLTFIYTYVRLPFYAPHVRIIEAVKGTYRRTVPVYRGFTIVLPSDIPPGMYRVHAPGNRTTELEVLPPDDR